eukprot:TRINITY_DN663_c0_g1_i9.p1 TRINITY_DN663_c0_g1~~TRINITY_DN663_c0_g1_i9.p1  ORF type:complete len:181 (-),score=11.86 TRINITY_DN663_c0_g1_i9:593-1135(-)
MKRKNNKHRRKSQNNLDQRTMQSNKITHDPLPRVSASETDPTKSKDAQRIAHNNKITMIAMISMSIILLLGLYNLFSAVFKSYITNSFLRLHLFALMKITSLLRNFTQNAESNDLFFQHLDLGHLRKKLRVYLPVFGGLGCFTSVSSYPSSSLVDQTNELQFSQFLKLEIKRMIEPTRSW